MYLKRYGRVDPPDVAQFLILDRDFPRAIHFFVIEAEESMRHGHRITGGHFRQPGGAPPRAAARAAGL